VLEMNLRSGTFLSIVLGFLFALRGEKKSKHSRQDVRLQSSFVS